MPYIFTSSTDCRVYICDFQHEQAWKRWIEKTSNGLSSHKQVVLAKLHAIARAKSEAEMNSRQVEELENSDQ